MRLSSFFLLLLASCGGQVGDPTAAPGTPTSHDGPHSHPNIPANGALDPSGSFDLTFDTAVAKPVDAQGPSAPAQDAPPSRRVASRLDLFESGDGWTAALTGRWNDTGTFTVEANADAFVLTGSARIFDGQDGVDDWTTLTLPRGADGKLTGQVIGKGDHSFGQGDVEWSYSLTGGGHLVADRTRPELRLAPISTVGPGDALLPWESFVVEAAEPVTGARESTMLYGRGGDALAIAWSFDPHQVGAPTTAFTGFAQEWPRAAAGEVSKLGTAGSQIVDRAGWTANAWYTSLSYKRLGGPFAQVGFDDDVVVVNPWGPWTIYGGGISGATDPRCESGGCLALGPAQVSWCAPTRTGFAAELTPGTEVEIRYRILASPTDGSGVPTFFTDPFTLEVANASGRATDKPLDAELHPLDATVDGYAFATDWTTLTVAVPLPPPPPAPSNPSTGPLGFAVFAGNRSVLNGGCGGPPPPASPNTKLLVEYVKSR